jgi:hypothetical protein
VVAHNGDQRFDHSPSVPTQWTGTN